jgi:hypothetical protein
MWHAALVPPSKGAPWHCPDAAPGSGFRASPLTPVSWRGSDSSAARRSSPPWSGSLAQVRHGPRTSTPSRPFTISAGRSSCCVAGFALRQGIRGGIDGLTADYLGLRGSSGLSPLRCSGRRFTTPQPLRLTSLLAAERSQTRSAAAIAVFTADENEEPFGAGRRFYRVWLALCHTGFSVCPMSAMADSPVGAAFLRKRCAVRESERIVNVLRARQAPRLTATSPRIPLHELLA